MDRELTDEIDSFLKKEREKPPRDRYKELARKQLDALGYGILPQRLAEFLKDEGIISEVEKSIPDDGGGKVQGYINQLAGTMERIPNHEEAVRLLMTAFSGEPSRENEDGTIVITSFRIAQPSLTTVQTKFSMLRDKRDNPLYITDIKGTDGLVANLIEVSGFAEENEVSEIIGNLRKDGRIHLPHRSNKSLEMEVERPKSFEEKSTSRTAYSYRIQATYKVT